mgnify:CR=1 FL=1
MFEKWTIIKTIFYNVNRKNLKIVKSEIRIKRVDGFIDVNLEFSILAHNTPGKNGRRKCYIPAFDIYYSASSEDFIQKGRDIMMMWMDHFFLHVDQQKRLRTFAIHIHQLGFRAQNDMVVMQKMTHNNIVPAKFKVIDIKRPREFEDAETITQEAEMKIAV